MLPVDVNHTSLKGGGGGGGFQMRLGAVLVLTASRWTGGLCDEPDGCVPLAVERPRLSLCFDRAELLPGWRLAHLKLASASTVTQLHRF